MKHALLSLLIAPLLLGYSNVWALSPPEAPWEDGVNTTLDSLHEAASEAQEERYFSLFTEDAIFVGTDAKERWNMKQFRAYAHPHFSRGEGWTYVSYDRHLMINKDKTVVWFDELLTHEKYGRARGSGVLILQRGQWKIAHYVLSFPIPNERAQEVIRLIKSAP